jgi:hypothetical protein
MTKIIRTRMPRPERRQPPSLMDRTRAAVAYVNGRNSREVELHAFMALFHPNRDPRSLVKRAE